MFKGQKHSKKSKQKIRDANKGKHYSPKTEFKKGMIPWNKGLTGIYSEKTIAKMKMSKKGQKPWNTGRERPEMIGKNNSSWKGDDVGYGALHSWVKRMKGDVKKYKCERCKIKQAKHWANKNHLYKRNIEDYLALCVSCHRIFDYKHNLKSDNKIGNNQYTV